MSRIDVRYVDDIFGELTITWGDATTSTRRFVRGRKLPRLEDALIAQGLDSSQVAAVANELGVKSRSPERGFRFDDVLVRHRLWDRHRAEYRRAAEAAMLELYDLGFGPTRIAQILNERGLRNRGWTPYTPDVVTGFLRKHGRRSAERLARLKARVAKLDAMGLTADEIAQDLNDAGFRTRTGKAFDCQSIYDLPSQLGRQRASARRRRIILELQAEGLSASQIAEELNRRGIRTHRGTQFTGKHVCHVLWQFHRAPRKTS